MWPFKTKTIKPPPALPAPRRRSFEAARSSRLLADLAATESSTNEILRGDLRTLRNRCRNLELNNAHARRFLTLIEMNVIGPKGIMFSSRAETRRGRPDPAARAEIEAAFKDWAKSIHASADGMDSWRGIQRIAVRTAATCGEVLIRRVIDSGDRYGLRLQIIDPDYLPITLNETAPNGNTIRMGIELGRYGRPVAYWLAASHPGDRVFIFQSGQYERVEAADIIHLFYRQRPHQLRGIPWMAAALIDAHHLDKYLEATLVKQRVEASKMGFITQDEGSQGYEGQGTENDGAIVSEVAAGTIEILEPGQDFKAFDPSSTDTLEGFTKTILRRIAVGMGVSYHSLTGDLTQVNYSSIRAGKLEDQDLYQIYQEWLIDTLCERVWGWWTDIAALRGIAGFNMVDLPRLARVEFQGRRWAWVDPLKEINAKIQSINAGLESRVGVIREMGRDPDQVTEEILTDDFIPASNAPAMAGDDTATDDNEGENSDGSTNAA